MKFIFCAANKTATHYFETKNLALEFISHYGPTVGFELMQVAVMQEGDYNKPFESRLKPCPFCGTTESFGWDTKGPKRSEQIEHQSPTYYFVECTACRMRGPFDPYGEKEDAVAKWNQRV